MNFLSPLAVLSAASNSRLEFLFGVGSKGVVVLLVASLVALSMRRSSAAARHLVWSAAIAALLLVPALDLMLPGLRLPILPFRDSDPTSRVMSRAGSEAIQRSASQRPEAGYFDDDFRDQDSAALPDKSADRAFAQNEKAATSKDTARTASTKDSATSEHEPQTRDFATSEDQAKTKDSEKTDADAVDLFISMPPSKAPDVGGRIDAGGQIADSRLPVRPRVKWTGLFFSFWAACFLVVLFRVVLAARSVSRLVQSAEPVCDGALDAMARELGDSLGLRSRVRLLRHPDLKVPVTWGIARPVILLPCESKQWSIECARVV